MHRERPFIPVDALLEAYRSGWFPMADAGTGEVAFYTVGIRCVIPLDERFRVSDSLARRVRSGRFEIRIDSEFAQVIRMCATERADGGTWIDETIIRSFERLHDAGHAHSVEAWRGGQLVGGLYGVAIGGAFFGESMFSLPQRGGTDASKVALVHLVHRLRARGFSLLDSQYSNPHIMRFGAQEIPESEYLERLAAATGSPASFCG
jgi:leucyl/phenylalanyl-tRNA--protein transferase